MVLRGRDANDVTRPWATDPRPRDLHKTRWESPWGQVLLSSIALSPLHRMLMPEDQYEIMLFCPESLVAAVAACSDADDEGDDRHRLALMHHLQERFFTREECLVRHHQLAADLDAMRDDQMKPLLRRL